MLKRWAAWPWGIRCLTVIAAVVLGLAFVWALFAPAPDWLAHYDVGSAKAPLLETARDAARGRLLTLVAGLFAAGALWFTALNFSLSREGQVTDRYTKAITQLGDEKLDVRIGGIYALERVARDSARDHTTVMEVLTAFIREHSQEQWPQSDPGGREQERSPRPDVRAAVTVVGRRDAERDMLLIDLGGAKLAGVDLTLANLTRAKLTRADLTDADLTFADLAGANLTRADPSRANIVGADLTRANLIDVDLAGANLSYADLTTADLSLLFDLTGATWPEDTPVPEVWKRDTGSSRLHAVDTGADTAEAN